VNDEIHDCVLTRKEPNALFACVNTHGMVGWYTGYYTGDYGYKSYGLDYGYKNTRPN